MGVWEFGMVRGETVTRKSGSKGVKAKLTMDVVGQAVSRIFVAYG
jgi:hypothetical protein